MSLNRRDLLTGISIVGVGAVLGGACRRQTASGPSSATNDNDQPEDSATSPGEPGATADVTAVEDLMREHGILRRALLVYHESAIKLRDNSLRELRFKFQ